MSIQSEIERINANILSAYNAVVEKGGRIPEQANSNNLATAIQAIPAGQEGDVFLVKAPLGTIVIWSGSEQDIPEGWHLCDGEDGTPDLRDKFVLCAGEAHSVCDNGGEEEVTLTTAQMPRHNHTIRNMYGSGSILNNSSSAKPNNYVANVINGSANLATDIAGSTGSDESHNNMPPYYALCYIMKIAPDETDVSADDVTFDPVETGIEATNVQGAIEELAKSGSGITSEQIKSAVVLTEEEYTELTDKDETTLYLIKE